MTSDSSDANADPSGTENTAPSADRHHDRPLSLDEAADAYRVSKRTLLRALSFGELDAHKVRGVRGHEWRVMPSALVRAGYAPRDQTDDVNELPCGDCRRLREQLAVERARNADLDNRLGHALLTAGRLRGQLLAASIQPDPRFPPAPDTIYLDAPKDERAVVRNDGGDDR